MSDDTRQTKQIWAPHELVERRHAEHKAMVSKIHSRMDELEKRDTLQGAVLDHHEHRLNAGAEKMATLDAQLRPSARTWIAGCAAAIVFVGGLVWAAAKYPTADEVDDMNRSLHQLQIQQAKLQQSVEALLDFHRKQGGLKP